VKAGKATSGVAASESSILSPPRSRRRRVFKAIAVRLAVLAGIVAAVRLTGCMERLFYHPTVGPTPAASHMEEVWFESRDGTRLFGWWIPAKGRAEGEGPAPTILHLHGNAGNIRDHVWFTQHLPPAGFNVFIFDYRGYGQSAPGRLRRANLLHDAHGALDLVLRRKDVDPARVAVYGQSLGAAIGIALMAERKEIAAGVFESPFASWRGVAASVIGGDPPGVLAKSLAWLFISDSHSPAKAICTIDRPILLLHGDADEIAPVSHSRLLAEANAGHCKALIFEGGQHNTLKDSHPEAAGEMIEFLTGALAAGRSVSFPAQPD
jgi:dipeptidyl aminopeptidase/acylaminoacyl peptidase